MRKRRLSKLARWMAGIYLVWVAVVFFGSLPNESHSWWPIFVYPLLWPLSALYETGSSALEDWLMSNPNPTSPWTWVVSDWAAVFFYLVVGTVWMWCLGRFVSLLATRLFPLGKPD